MTSQGKDPMDKTLEPVWKAQEQARPKSPRRVAGMEKELEERIIKPPHCRGKIGGKSRENGGTLCQWKRSHEGSKKGAVLK